MQEDASKFILMVFSKLAAVEFCFTVLNQFSKRNITGSMMIKNNSKAISCFLLSK
jgi:hypothetical protein